NETGEFELVVGDRQLLSAFFIVVLLCAVAFAMGYVVGQNAPKSGKATAESTPTQPAASAEARPQPLPPAPAPVPPPQPAPADPPAPPGARRAAENPRRQHAAPHDAASPGIAAAGVRYAGRSRASGVGCQRPDRRGRSPVRKFLAGDGRSGDAGRGDAHHAQ